MSGYPVFGTHPIKCSKKGCDWVGYETNMSGVEIDSITTQRVCPICGNDSYYFMSQRQMKYYQLGVRELKTS